MDNYISRSLFEMYPMRFGFFAKLGAHQTMLSDTLRCEAYKSAIKQAVREGDVVLDIGAGTGILSIFAAQAGARKVYAIETNPVVFKMLQAVIRDNPYPAIEIIEGDSFDITLPERVDVVLSETIGFWGIDENIVGIFSDAKARFGHENTIYIPKSIELYLVPIQCESFYKEVEFWKQNSFGINFKALDQLSKKNIYIRQVVKQNQFLSTPQMVIDTIPTQIMHQQFKGNLVFNIAHSSTLHGFAGWFQANLYSDVVISTSPLHKTLHWKHCIFPIEQPLELYPNDQVELDVEVTIKDNKDINFCWITRVLRANTIIAEFRQNTF